MTNKYWDQVLSEVNNKNTPDYDFLYTNVGGDPDLYEEKKPTYNNKKSTHTYTLDGALEGKYLTGREADCIYFMLDGHTIKSVGSQLQLSPRTVEYYLQNVKDKLGCHKKTDVLAKIKQTSFITKYLNKLN